jgi:hypothetical protein
VRALNASCRAHAGLAHQPVEQRVECRFVDLHVLRRRSGSLGDPEGAAIQSFVEDRHPAAIEEKNFQRITAATEKEE